MPVMQGLVNAPGTASAASGSNNPALQGRQNELIVSELAGKYYTQAYNGNVFAGFVTGVTVPVIAANLVSVCSLFNPANSNRNLVLVGADVGILAAATVVDAVNLYFQKIGGAVTIPTGQTAGTVVNGVLGGNANPQGLFLSAATHVGTPAICAIVSTFGAVTSSADNPVRREFDGTIILPPNTIVSFAMSTTVSTASGLALGIQWVETPL